MVAVFLTAHLAEIELKRSAAMVIQKDCTEAAVNVQSIELTTAPGSGLRCDECHQPIESEQVECRCFDMNHSSTTQLRFHQWCHYARSRRGL